MGIREKGAHTRTDWILDDYRVPEVSQFQSGHTTESFKRNVFNDPDRSRGMGRANTNVDAPFRFAVRGSQRQRRLPHVLFDATTIRSLSPFADGLGCVSVRKCHP